MAAASTDKLKKLSKRWVGQVGSGGVADGVTTTIPLSSTTNLATDTAVVATIDRVDANGAATPNLEESLIGVVSGANLITCVRGVEGTAQAHNAGAVVEILVTAKGWNDIVDHLLVEHNQDGTHKTPVVTLTGTQSLTNKTITDSTNNVMAKSLKSATTTVDVSAATAPTSGQVLTATSSTTATWQTPSTSALSSKVITSTRNLAAANGNVSYTGVGFQPTSIIAFAAVSGGAGTAGTEGFSDSTKTAYTKEGSVIQSNLLYITNASGNAATADILTYDADGFTLTWTKVNSPTGTAELRFLCLK